MKTNLDETIDETTAVYPLKIRANRRLRRSALLAAGLLLALGGGAGPVAGGTTDQTAANAYELSQLDKIPTPRYQAKPVYPSALSQAGVTGEVAVGFIVDTNGDVREAHAVKSTQHEFEASAIEAVTKWKFRPGEKGGKLVNTRLQVPIVFALAKGAPGAPNQSSTGKLQPFSVTEDKDASPKAKTN